MEQCCGCNRIELDSRGRYMRVYGMGGDYQIKYLCRWCSWHVVWMRLGLKARLGVMLGAALLGAVVGNVFVQCIRQLLRSL